MIKLPYSPTLWFGGWVGALVEVYADEIEMKLGIFTSAIFYGQVGAFLLEAYKLNKIFAQSSPQ